MTNEEAIKGLKNVSTMFTGYKPNEEMFEMAIKALETVSCIKEKCAYCPHCENCDVDDETLEIKTLEQQPCEDWYDVPSDEMTLEQARQAVKDLRKKLVEYLEQQPCEDCISRQAVHSLMATLLSDYLHDEDREKIELIDAEIAELPSVTPKEKTAHWINKTLIYKGETEGERDCYAGTCSACGTVQECWHYCSGCGARMVSE